MDLGGAWLPQIFSLYKTKQKQKQQYLQSTVRWSIIKRGMPVLGKMSNYRVTMQNKPKPNQPIDLCGKRCLRRYTWLSHSKCGEGGG